jgi:hypothetical protein
MYGKSADKKPCRINPSVLECANFKISSLGSVEMFSSMSLIVSLVVIVSIIFIDSAVFREADE